MATVTTAVDTAAFGVAGPAEACMGRETMEALMAMEERMAAAMVDRPPQAACLRTSD